MPAASLKWIPGCFGVAGGCIVDARLDGKIVVLVVADGGAAATGSRRPA